MDNQDIIGLATLVNGGVQVELRGYYGGVWDNYGYDYIIYIPSLQDYICGGDREDYDGVHYLDEPKYVGVGRTLEWAFDDFIKSNQDLESKFNGNYEGKDPSDLVEEYASEVIAKLSKEKTE